MSKKHKEQIFIIFSYFAIALFIAYFAIPILSRPIENDSKKYDTIAINLANNFEYTVLEENSYLISPGYPVFLALVYKLSGQNYALIYFIQFLLLAGMASLAFFISKKYLKLKNYQAFMPGLMILFWPYNILHASLLLTEILYSFLLSLFVYLLFNYLKNNTFKKQLIIGLLISAITLIRPIFLLLPFWLLMFEFIFKYYKKEDVKKINNQKLFKAYALPLIILFIIIFSWGAFGYKKTGHFSPFVTSNLKIFLFTTLLRTDNVPPQQESYNNLPKNKKPEVSATILTKIKNIYRFWNSGAAGIQAQELTKKFPPVKYFILIYKIIYYAILALAFYSLVYIKKNKYILILWLLIFYFWALHSVLFPMPRYTLPIVQFIILLSFYSLFKLKNLKLNNIDDQIN